MYRPIRGGSSQQSLEGPAFIFGAVFSRENRAGAIVFQTKGYYENGCAVTPPKFLTNDNLLTTIFLAKFYPQSAT